MTSRKKIAISITAVCVVLLVAVVTIVAVWAATRTNVNNSFKGNYIRGKYASRSHYYQWW